MDATQWTSQGIGVVKEVEISSSARQPQLQADQKRARPYKEQSLNCPRCNSTNTKFCYYNNYSLSQPRYFCKTCRRYWTEGGSLRNVPVGGGSRKNKKSSSSSSSSLVNSTSSTATATTAPMVSSSSTNLQPAEFLPTLQIPFTTSKLYQGSGQDLNLSFPNQSLAHHDQLGSLELLRGGISARGFTPFAAAPGSVFGPGFGFQELMRQSSLKLPLDHHGGFGGTMHQMQEGGAGRVLFPFEDLKHVHNGGHEEEQNGAVQGEGDPGLFWNGANGRGGGGAW